MHDEDPVLTDGEAEGWGTAEPASLVRWVMLSLSNSAMTARIPRKSLPAGVAVSNGSVSDW
jgi:hypothetical protein